MEGIVAILLMGGLGVRFGSELPKQFHRLSGKKVYLHTLERFLKEALFEEILLVVPAAWMEDVEHDLENYSQKNIRLVQAGETRQDSSRRGLLACKSSTRIVVIHDAVRPFVNSRILKENIAAAERYGAVDTCIPSADTIIHTRDGSSIETIPPRAEYLRGQTPQSFSFPLIVRAHEETQQANASDDCSLAVEFGHLVHIVAGEERNIKITTELDLFLADQLLRLEQTQLLPTEKSLKGMRFVITGGMGGIGSTLATFLEGEGALPIIVSRNSPQYPFDLTSSENVEKAFQKIHEEHGLIDGLINCMGLLKVQQFETLTAQEIEELIDVNLFGPIFCCRYAQVREGGHLVNIASSSYSRGRKDYTLYSSAKAALVNFTQGLAEERPAHKVNAVIPGRTNTAMRHTQFPDEEKESLLSPEQVATTILSLLKQDHLTGLAIKV